MPQKLTKKYWNGKSIPRTPSEVHRDQLHELQADIELKQKFIHEDDLDQYWEVKRS